ncbi:MAG TPA: CBS domain-containing protein [Actinoplanes sp.]|nr:CBS domain-containing protein [Actinoplanes sp.]
MTKAVVSVQPTTTYRELVDLLIGRHVSAVPVVDGFQHVTGVILRSRSASQDRVRG